MTGTIHPDKSSEIQSNKAILGKNERSWHQNPSILISMLALLSSTALGVYMALKSLDENFYDKKEALRSTLSELMEIEEKAADLLYKSAITQNDSQNSNGALSTYVNSKSLALNNRRVTLLEYARTLVDDLDGTVTPVEYAVLGSAYQNAGRLDLAKKYYLDLTKSDIPYFKASAHRSLGRVDAATSNGINTSSVHHYKAALDALKNQDDSSSVSFKAHIYLEWAKYYAMYCIKGESLKVLGKARNAVLYLPTSIESRAIMLRQIEESQSTVITSCPG